MAHELLILLATVWTLGKVFRVLRLPGIFGELMAGVLVGPLILGAVEETEAIKTLAELGIFFLMLHAGLETDPKDFFHAAKKYYPVSIGSMVLPLLGGYGVSMAFGYSVEQSMYVAIGLSITAIAVSVRLFKDSGVHKSKVAHVAMGSALMQDIAALILFSIALNIFETGTIDLLTIVMLIAKIVVFFGVVLFVGDKLFQHIHKILYSGNKGFTFTVIVALAFGLLAEMIGLHIIVGAFLAGLFIREEIVEEKLFLKIEDRIFGMSYSFLGPIFFASLAFHLDFSIVTSNPSFLGMLILVAIVAKIVGAAIPAYFLKMNKFESLAIGVAMNSRGAVELIIATIGLEMGIITPELFSALVIMAFVTTLFSIIIFKPISKRFHGIKESVMETVTMQKSV